MTSKNTKVPTESRKMWKTTIVIWSDVDPGGAGIEEIASEATSGGYYCSRQRTQMVEDFTADPDWDDTEFFNLEAQESDDEEDYA